jgi:putative sterol carrier protein
MTEEGKFSAEEKANMLEMLTDTLHALVKEKLIDSKWKEKIKKISFRINLEIIDAGAVNLILKEGNYTLGNGKIADPIIEIKAPLVNFFNFSSRQLSTFSAIFLGKLKIKGKRHLGALLNVGDVLRIIK